jgi:sugar phosphate permease
MSIVVFWKIQVESQLLTTGLMGLIGFFVYGPQCLLAVTAANLATKRAAGTAFLATPAQSCPAGTRPL